MPNLHSYHRDGSADTFSMKILIGILAAILLSHIEPVTAQSEEEQLGETSITEVNIAPFAPCNCNYKFNPVCGSDGKSYVNKCWLNCESKIRQKQGLPPIFEISKGECGCFCPAVSYPICASDGKTYDSPCKLGCENKRRQLLGLPPLKKISNGACKPCKCPLIEAPVCGSDGNTYTNWCFLNCENQRRAKLGLFPLWSHNGVCPCWCPYIYDPVCAKNGKTYTSQCMLNCVNWKRHQQGLPPLKIVYKGECGSKCKYNCPKIYKPVCGSDNKTYANKCLLDCENARRASQHLPPLKYTLGTCPCACNCPSPNQPACGSDGKTYKNVCFLHCNSNCNSQAGWPAIFFKTYGSC